MTGNTRRKTKCIANDIRREFPWWRLIVWRILLIEISTFATVYWQRTNRLWTFVRNFLTNFMFRSFYLLWFLYINETRVFYYNKTITVILKNEMVEKDIWKIIVCSYIWNGYTNFDSIITEIGENFYLFSLE